MSDSDRVLDITTGEIRPAVTVALIRPVVTPAVLIEAKQELVALIQKALKPGTDYGVIPGTKGKPSLLKPGAELVASAYGCRPEFDLLVSEADHFHEVPWQKRQKVWNNKHPRDKTFTWREESGTAMGLYRYLYRCRLIHRQTGEEVGQGVGSCSTLEAKYCDRPREAENTVTKMAKKRAFVDAVLTTFSLSDRFTQDLEDAGFDPEPSVSDSGSGTQPKRRDRKPATAAPDADPQAPLPNASTPSGVPSGTVTQPPKRTWRERLRDLPDAQLAKNTTWAESQAPPRQDIVDAVDEEYERRRDAGMEEAAEEQGDAYES